MLNAKNKLNGIKQIRIKTELREKTTEKTHVKNGLCVFKQKTKRVCAKIWSKPRQLKR